MISETTLRLVDDHGFTKVERAADVVVLRITCGRADLAAAIEDELRHQLQHGRLALVIERKP